MNAGLDSTPVGLILLDRQFVTRLVTAGAANLLDLRGRCAGRSLSQLLAQCRAVDPVSRQMVAAALGHAPRHEPRDMLLSLQGAGGPRMVAIDIRPAGRQGWVMSLEDVTQTRQTQDWLLEHVSTDPVTGLWNRQHFMLMLHDVLAAGAAGAAGPAVLLLNLHRFKLINDTLGTLAGDMILRMVGDRLAGALGPDDLLGRAAGNEFVMALCPAGGKDAVAAHASALIEALSHPFPVEGQSVTLPVKIGIALAPEHGHAAETLMANAALAVKAAEGDAPARLRFFEPELTARAQLRRGLEADLRLALSRGEFVLHYQPQVDVHRGCVTGMEALIRWFNPARGMVSPAEFIPLAEELDLICDIGQWVLLEACREASLWPAEISVAVNASPLQFETGDFAQTVAKALAQTGLPAGRLEIEITESLLLRDTGTVKTALTALQRQGVRLVLDDFGTGYASLSQLSRFRFDKIKIDRSFVSPPDASAENSAIVRSIAALARSLRIPSTAEGVETQTQLEQITADGCTLVQGYYFSRPVPPATVPEVLARLHRPQACVAA